MINTKMYWLLYFLNFSFKFIYSINMYFILQVYKKFDALIYLITKPFEINNHINILL